MLCPSPPLFPSSCFRTPLFSLSGFGTSGCACYPLPVLSFSETLSCSPAVPPLPPSPVRTSKGYAILHRGRQPVSCSYSACLCPSSLFRVPYTGRTVPSSRVLPPVRTSGSAGLCSRLWVCSHGESEKVFSQWVSGSCMGQDHMQ